MADTVEITPGTGAVIGTDEVTIGGALQQVQRVKLVDGTDGGTDLLPGSTDRGLQVDPRAKVVRVSGSVPGMSTSAYAAKDAIGTGTTLASVNRASGKPVVLQSIVLRDVDQTEGQMDLVIFDTALASVTDNAVFDPTDAELLNLLAVVPIVTGDYADFNDNEVAFRGPLGLDLLPTGTDLYVYCVAREAITYASTPALQISATFLQT